MTSSPARTWVIVASRDQAVRDHLPADRIRFGFGFFDLPADDAAAIWRRVPTA